MRFKFKDKKKEAGDAVSFIFDPVEPINWSAGQFLVYFLDHPDSDIRGKQRFFTISSCPFERTPMITTRIVPPQRDPVSGKNPSTFKKALNLLEPGDEIEAKGPDGDFTIDDPSKNFVFIAGGIGITPFRSIIEQLDFEKKPINVTLLYANKTEDFFFKLFFEEIASRNKNFKIHYIVSPQHIDEQVIKETVPNLNEPIFYVSGPEKMVEDFGEMLKGMGIKDDHIKQDYFPGYETF